MRAGKACIIELCHKGDCQNYGPFLGPYYNTGPNLGDPKRDHNFDSSPQGPQPTSPSKAVKVAKRHEVTINRQLGRGHCL